ncbi:MAG: S41 family peptidase [Cyanobacteria bacterium P01_F01_bin.42]
MGRMRLRSLGIALLSLMLTVGDSYHSSANIGDSPKAVVDEAWQIVQREYVDRSFNGQDWDAVRQDYISRDYQSLDTAYRAVSRMVGSLKDEYTKFLSPQALKEIVNNVSGEFIGVGVVVSPEPVTREWLVVRSFVDSPAANAGLQPNDLITRINGTKTSDIDLNQAAPYLIGPVGSKVQLGVKRQSQELEFELIREQINLKPLTYRVIESATGSVGYIRLPVFTSKSPAAMKSAIEALDSQNVEGFVLDLRGNPGGVLDAGIAIARMWIHQGKIMSLTSGSGQPEEYDANRTSLTQKPVQVLIDQKSASASEVVASAIQENQRGQLVGEQSFGKGVVQSLEKLGADAGLIITVAQYFTPSGKNIHKTGIRPDQLVQPTVQPPDEADNLDADADRIFKAAWVNLLTPDS